MHIYICIYIYLYMYIYTIHYDPSQLKMTKQAFMTDFFNYKFLVLKFWLTLIKNFGGGILIEN